MGLSKGRAASDFSVAIPVNFCYTGALWLTASTARHLPHPERPVNGGFLYSRRLALASEIYAGREPSSFQLARRGGPPVSSLQHLSVL